MGNTIGSSSTQALPTCTFNTTRSSHGERSNGDKFSEVLRILYTYGASSCCVEIHENGAAKRTEKVWIGVVDKDENSDNLVDAHVTVKEDRSGMTVRSCKLNPQGGVIENWCDSRHWVQAIRYFSAQRYGLFALIRQMDENGGVGCDEVTVQHYYATRSNKDGGFVVDVKVKYDRMSRGYVVEVEGPRATHHGASFCCTSSDTDDSDHIETKGEDKGDSSFKVKVAGNPIINCTCCSNLGYNYNNSGGQKNRGMINSNGYSNGVGNNSIFYHSVNFWRNRLDSVGRVLQDPSAHRALFLAPLYELVGKM